MLERSSTLGTWIKRFVMEYLPTERNLAINTLKSYRDGLTLLLPFVAERYGKAVERLAVEDLSADRVTAILGHLEQERGCSVQTRNLRLTAIRSFARYVAVRDAALVAWAGRLRAIPLKKTVRPRITWLPAENMDAMIAGPDILADIQPPPRSRPASSSRWRGAWMRRHDRRECCCTRPSVEAAYRPILTKQT